MNAGDDAKLAAVNRFRGTARAERAFERVFWSVGLVAAMPGVIFMMSSLILDGASFGEWLRTTPQLFGAAVMGCLVFGSGPAVVAMVWVRFFPDTWLGDDVLFSPKKSHSATDGFDVGGPEFRDASR